jgi:hypothetical protein
VSAHRRDISMINDKMVLKKCYFDIPSGVLKSQGLL